MVGFEQSRHIIAISLLIGTPLFLYFGWLSDKFGRKVIMMSGLFLAVILYRPIYMHMYAITDISQKKEVLEKAVYEELPSTDPAKKITSSLRTFEDGTTLKEVTTTDTSGKEKPVIKKEVTLEGDLYYSMIGMILIQVVLVTMVYGPIAAYLVEIFPTRIRYTSMSLPYHIGNGIFGGLTPLIGTWLYDISKTEAKPDGDPFAGLWYPIAVAAISFIIGMIFLSNRRKADVMEE